MAIPQYAMAQSGTLSTTFANIFSASSYSNECNRAMPTLKSFLHFSGTDAEKETVPNISPSCGPQVIISPLLSSGKVAEAINVLFLSLQEIQNTRMR